jgi:hypothetical protein
MKTAGASDRVRRSAQFLQARREGASSLSGALMGTSCEVMVARQADGRWGERVVAGKRRRRPRARADS